MKASKIKPAPEPLICREPIPPPPPLNQRGTNLSTPLINQRGTTNKEPPNNRGAGVINEVSNSLYLLWCTHTYIIYVHNSLNLNKCATYVKKPTKEFKIYFL